MNAPIQTALYRRLDRALSRVFWGLLFAVLLAIGIIQIPALNRWAIPAAAIPMLYALWGLWELRRESVTVAPTWKKLTRHTFLAALLALYFLPIMQWWLGNLGSYFLAVNALVATVAFTALLIFLNLVPAELTRLRDDEPARRELVFSAWFTAAMLLFIGGTIAGYGVYWVVTGRGLPFKDFANVAPVWHLRAITLLPVGLTLISLLKGRIGLRIAGNSNLR